MGTLNFAVPVVGSMPTTAYPLNAKMVPSGCMAASAPTSQSTGVHAHGGPQGIELDGERFNTRAISLMINSLISMPIVDKTGLPPTAYYDVALKFNRDESAASAPDAYPSLVTAIEEQLGLKLEPATAPIDTLVIDSAEHPSEN